MGYHSYIYIMQ